MIKTAFKILVGIFAVLMSGIILFWFSRPADISYSDLKSTIPHSEFSKFAVIDGVKIHYQEKGNGTPLVLIHGYTSSTYTWKDVFLPLAEKYRVIAIDLKGFGFSEKPSGDYSRRAQGELVAKLLEHLKIEKAWLAGNSMGGETALNVAVKNPQKIIGLILIDSAGVPVKGATSLAPWYLQSPVLGPLLTAFGLSSDKLVREGLQKSYYDHSIITEDRVNYYYQPLKTRDGQSAAIQARSQFKMYPIEKKLSGIKMPVLLIWGQEDEIIPLEAGRKMNSLIPGSKLLIFEHCGHVPQEEMPERVLAEITGFIDNTNVETR